MGNEQSRSVAKSLIISDGHRSGVFEIILRNLLWMQIMHSDVHVKTGLNIVFRNASFLEIISCASHTIRYGFIAGRHPTALHFSSFLLISIFFLVLTEHGGNSLDGLFRINLLVLPSRSATLIKLAHGSTSHGNILNLSAALKSSLKFGDIVSIFLLLRMLRHCGFEITTIHENIPLILNLFSVIFIDDVVIGLVWLHLGMRMN